MVNQFLALSMFIMLLSFFIILNSMSNFEESVAKTVMASLSLTFSEPTPDLDAKLEEDVAQSFSEGTVLDRLQSLFQSQIIGTKIRKNRLGTVMQIHMPVQVFEDQLYEDTRDPSGAGVDLKATLVSLLTNNKDFPYKMEILLSVPKSPSALYHVQPDYMRSQIKRVAGFAQLLEGVGMPKPYVTPGLVEGRDGTVSLFFRPYKPFTPVGDDLGAEDAEASDASDVGRGDV